MELTTKQKEFLQAVQNGENVFLTGKAGTGKSFIVREAFTALKDAGKKFVAVAPTGIAANNIDGQTIHSLFAVAPFGVSNFETCNFLSKGKKEVLRKADTIFIDEISMLRPDLLDAMHFTLKKSGLPGLDKKQIVFVGDLMQLPTILDDNTRSVLYQTYDGDTFLDALILKRVPFRVIELDEIKRQADTDFINALNEIREGRKSEYFRQFVHSEAKGIILAPHNATVFAYNQKGLDAQPGETHVFKARTTGTVKAEDFNMEQEIKVKDGCKIMYLVNSVNNPLRNGTIGTFVAKSGEDRTGKKTMKYLIKVHGVEYPLELIEQTKKEYVYNKAADTLELTDLGSITQMPIKLAYALSIHKAQGLTFEEVTVDLTRPVFQKGQMYVGLSRVTGPAGLRIITK
jgi:ATP-dependent DNA helicase PIF1